MVIFCRTEPFTFGNLNSPFMKPHLLIFAAMLTLVASGQNIVLKPQSELAVSKAKVKLSSQRYAEARDILEEALKADPNSSDVYFYLGRSYQGLGEGEKAVTYFAKSNALTTEWLKTAQPGSNEILKIHTLQYQSRYAEGQVKLLRMPRTMKDPVRISGATNSAFGDYLPMMDPTGTRLYFTSTRPDTGGSAPRSFLKSKTSKKSTETEAVVTESDEDIYFVDKSGSDWGTPVKLPEPLNTEANDGAACFSADGQLMVYGSCGLSDGMGSCDIYYSTLENGRWATPRNLGDVVNSPEWDAQYSLSYDGSKLFFVSSRCGVYGETDLYVTERNIFGEWGPAMNLGGIVNTPFNEYAPFISQDGKTLYFSSDGHPGFGGLDIFKTVYDNGKWSVPVNLGRPLNTEKDDKYFTIGGSGEVGYFSSDLDGKSFDIYQIEIPEEMRPQPTIVITGTVTNAKSKDRVGAYVMIEDLDTQELIAINKSNATTGKYVVVLPGGRNYSVSANKEGYFFYSQSFDVPKKVHYQEIVQDIELKPIEKGTKVVINNIFFETGKAALTPQSYLELEKAIDLLRTNPTMVIEVGGHTDNVGDDATNMKLSHDRAKTVREFLVSRGIASERAQAKGYGESNPIATNDTDDGRKANRRTEFIILEF
jgi:outer membrane protein OmpA-like peptidoglycan-associated protein